MSSQFVLTQPGDKSRLIALIDGLNLEKPMVFSWKLYKKQRSLSANALSHVWYKEIASELQQRGSKSSPDEVKQILKYNFLGLETRRYKDFSTGEWVETEELKKTSHLDSGEMCFYMEQVRDWAGSMGILLETPEESEFYKWQMEQVA